MAWHHAECITESGKCATCGGAAEKLNTATLCAPSSLELSGIANSQLRSLVARSWSEQSKEATISETKNLVSELRLLETILLQKIHPGDFAKLIFPTFKGIKFNSKIKPLNKSNTDLCQYVISFHHHGYTGVIDETTFGINTYHSLHSILPRTPKLDPKALPWLIKIKYHLVSDLLDPFNCGKNAPLVAHSELDYHFLIQLLQSLLSTDSLEVQN